MVPKSNKFSRTDLGAAHRKASKSPLTACFSSAAWPEKVLWLAYPAASVWFCSLSEKWRENVAIFSYGYHTNTYEMYFVMLAWLLLMLGELYVLGSLFCLAGFLWQPAGRKMFKSTQRMVCLGVLLIILGHLCFIIFSWTWFNSYGQFIGPLTFLSAMKLIDIEQFLRITTIKDLTSIVLALSVAAACLVAFFILFSRVCRPLSFCAY